MAEKQLLGAQEPRIKVIPEGEDHPRWDEIVEFIERLGYELDPWQWMVLRTSLLRRDDQWAAFSVAVCAPRQNGKNTLLEVVELVASVLLEEKLLIHTAHLADTSKEAFHRLDDVIDTNDWLRKDLKHIWRTNGMETIEFRGGRRIRFRTRTRGGGRGYAGCGKAIFDEAMFLPEASMSSIMPVVSASPDPQVWYTGSAVDQENMDDGVAFARVRDRALKGDTERLAYFEWSLELDSPDQVDEEIAENPESWAIANPGFGIRLKSDTIKEERLNVSARTFAVERLGVGDWPATDANALALENWDALLDPDSVLLDPFCLAFDISPDRSYSSIAMAGKREDGLAHVELPENRAGTAWVVKRITEIVRKHHPVAVICDGVSQAGSLIPELEQNGVEVTKVGARDHANACGLIFDLVEQEGLRHLGSRELKDALKGAAQRPLGDSWAWSRKNSKVDISPLVAATLALWGFSVNPAGGDILPDMEALWEAA